MMENVNGLSRREFMQTLAGLGSVGCMATGAWGALEWLVPPEPADQWRKSVCRFCGVGCGVMVGLRQGKVTAIRGDELAHNHGVICVKGSLLSELPRLQGRLTSPRIRQGGAWLEATWEDALQLAAGRFQEAIRQSGPDAVAFYGSGQLYTEESYTANKLFKAGIGTNNVDGNPRLCMSSASAGYTRVFGKDEPPGAYEDIDSATCFFMVGSNAYECHPALFERVRERRRTHPGTRLICVDPRRTRTAELSDLHLPIKPGTDLTLLNSMAHCITESGWAAPVFIRDHIHFKADGRTIDYAGFRNFLNRFRPETVAAEVGVSSDLIRQAAMLFARSEATVSLWTMGINQQVNGTAANEMLSALHLITGQIGRPGATPLSLTGQCNACGGVRDTGTLSHLLPAGRLVSNPRHRAEMEDLWHVSPGTISARPGHDAISLFRAMERGEVSAALVMSSNPAQSLPNIDRYRPALERCFLVVSEIFADSETAQVADVLLPAALWVEKTGVYGQTERRYQLVEKLIEPPGQARSDLDILVGLADLLGHGDLITARTPEAVWNEWRRLSAHGQYNFSGITYERLRLSRGLQWPCPDASHPGTVRRYVEGDDPFVPKGKGIHFYGHPDGRAVVSCQEPVISEETPDEEYPLVLTTGRVLEQWHTGTMTGRIGELDKAAGPARLEVHPLDADHLAISQGRLVTVESRFGSLDAQVHVTERSRPGTVFAAFYDVKLLINRVVADHVDGTSKQPAFKMTAVRVRPA